MASIPEQFTESSLQHQLQSARSLKQQLQQQPQALHSGIEALDRCFEQIKPGDLVE